MKLIEYLPNDYTKSGSTLELLEALEKCGERRRRTQRILKSSYF